jgi:hypothetical protein
MEKPKRKLPNFIYSIIKFSLFLSQWLIPVKKKEMNGKLGWMETFTDLLGGWEKTGTRPGKETYEKGAVGSGNVDIIGGLSSGRRAVAADDGWWGHWWLCSHLTGGGLPCLWETPHSCPNSIVYTKGI